MARFASKYREHRIVISPARQIRDEAGRVVEYAHGRAVVFVDHIYETADPQEIEFLRALCQRYQDIFELTGIQASVEPQRPEVVHEISTARVSSSRGPIRCEDCGRAFGSPQALAVHRGKAHGRENTEQEESHGERVEVSV